MIESKSRIENIPEIKNENIAIQETKMVISLLDDENCFPEIFNLKEEDIPHRYCSIKGSDQNP